MKESKLIEMQKKNRNTRKPGATNNATDGTPKRPFDWDARDIKTYPWVRGSSGKYENRYFEQDDD